GRAHRHRQLPRLHPIPRRQGPDHAAPARIDPRGGGAARRPARRSAAGRRHAFRAGREDARRARIGRGIMLYTIALVLLLLSLLGFVSTYTMGGLIHVLFVIAVVIVLVRLISGRKPI